MLLARRIGGGGDPSQEAAMRPKDQPDPLDQRSNQIIDECENMK